MENYHSSNLYKRLSSLIGKVIPVLFFCIFLLCVYLIMQTECIAKKKALAISRQDLQYIQKKTFENIFMEYLSLHTARKRSDIIISKFKVTGDQPVPKGRISFQIFQKNQRRLSGLVRLIAVVRVNNVEENRVRLSGWVDIFGSIVCARENIKKGDTVTTGNVCLIRRNISHLSANILSDIDKAIGLTAKHNIKAETCLKAWMLVKPPAVNKGDIVTILAESGALKVTVPGMAMGGGHLGEVIRVENVMSKKKVYAKVINDSTVVVDF